MQEGKANQGVWRDAAGLGRATGWPSCVPSGSPWSFLWDPLYEGPGGHVPKGSL